VFAAAILRRVVLRPLTATALLRVGSRAAAARGGTALLGPGTLVRLALRPCLGARDRTGSARLEVAGLRVRLEMLLLRPLEAGASVLRIVLHRASAAILAIGPRWPIRPHRRGMHRPARRTGRESAITVEFCGSCGGRDRRPAVVVVGAQRVIGEGHPLLPLLH
jgi:hypothetical protein